MAKILCPITRDTDNSHPTGDICFEIGPHGDVSIQIGERDIWISREDFHIVAMAYLNTGPE